MMPSPVIVIGMHRSGTSLVSRILERMGIFMGWRQDENSESWFFQKLNDWMITQTGGSWDNPGPFRYASGSETVRGFFADYAEMALSSPRRVSYLGPWRGIRVKSIADLPELWGWKDPRNTFTLRVWLEKFPDAKVLHVKRHALDVANSLMRRQNRIFDEFLAEYRGRKWLYKFKRFPSGFLSSARSSSLTGALSIWCEYMEQAAACAEMVTPERHHEMRYEDLLGEPESTVQQLSDFLSTSLDDRSIKDIVKSFDPSRAYAFRGNPDLAAHEGVIAQELRRFGY